VNPKRLARRFARRRDKLDDFRHTRAAPSDVPMSWEVARYVIADHARTCTGSRPRALICDCGTSGLVYCEACEQPLVVAMRVGGEVCAHAAALLWPEQP
jgi:hypothetical protein